MKCIKVHCGSAYVKGDAKKWRYYIASLFQHDYTKDGVPIWKNTGKHVGPFRSKAKTIREGEKWAETLKIDFIDGYGSLHNCKIPIVIDNDRLIKPPQSYDRVYDDVPF